MKIIEFLEKSDTITNELGKNYTRCINNTIFLTNS